MQSLEKIYKIGVGPSSSHTMGPKKAAEIFLARNQHAAKFKVSFYGSLAATGKGHLADGAVSGVLGRKKTEITWFPEKILPAHPNGMIFAACNNTGKVIDRWKAYSVGGGEISGRGIFSGKEKVYPHTTMVGIMRYSRKNNIPLWKYAYIHEKKLEEYLKNIWVQMQQSIYRGLKESGALPGSLHLQRKAGSYFLKSKKSAGYLKKIGLVFAYALAVSEENAAGGNIVTAPTCGSAGVIPAVLLFLKNSMRFPEKKIIQALAT